MASHSISPSPLKNTKIFPNNTVTTFLSKLFIQPTQKQLSLKTKPPYCSSTSTIPPLYIPNKIPNDKYIRILDTTLRDGEQAPGATMTTPQKLAIARELVKLRVDVIEAGFPASSKAEFEATQLIAKQIGNDTSEFGHVPVICAASRMVRKDIDTTWEAVRYAKHPRMNIFIPTSEIHMKYKLNKTKDEVLRIVEEMVSYTRSLGVMDITFISEDSARSEKEFLYQVFGEAIKAGATTVTFCDTVGCKLPNEWGEFIADMKSNVPGVENVIISTHCHNDLGLATANTLAAVSAGARQVEVTLNGIGERAGNAPLEEFVMAIKCRGEDNLGGLHTGTDTKHIVTSSKMVEKYSGLSLQPHKPIVGVNSFAHGSGIHQDGVLKNKSTYEFISPEDIGLDRSNDNGIVLGKLSGRHALKTRLTDLGYELDERNLDNIFWRFKALAEKKKIISDNDLVLLVSDDKALQPKESTWKLIDIEVSSSRNSLATANVKISDGGGQEHVASAVGTNSISAACKAIDLIVKVPVKIVECDMKMADEGLEGVASTRVILRREENKASSGPVIVSGTGSGDDIIIATAQAYVNALNRLLGVRNKIMSVVS